MNSCTFLPSFARLATLRMFSGALALAIACTPTLAGAAPSGEPGGGALAVPTVGLVNAALTAGMSSRKGSLLDAVSRDSEVIRDLVYNSAPPQDAPGQRQTYELSLLDAVELALENNLNVQVARYSPQSTFNGISSARGQFDATMNFSLPQSFSRGTSPTNNQIAGGDIITQQGLSGGFTWQENLEWGTQYSLSWSQNRNSTNNDLQTFNPTLGAGFSGNITQQLLRGRGDVNRTGIRVAMNQYDSSLQGFRAQVQGVLFQTINSYWNLRAAVESVGISEEALELASQQYDRNVIQVEIGTLAPIETVQAETSRAQSLLGLIQARQTLENAQDALKEFINFDAVVDDPFAYDLDPTEVPEQNVAPIDIEAAVRAALDNDTQLAQQRLNLRNADLSLAQARNSLLPSLSVRGTFNMQGRAGTRLLSGFGGAADETLTTGMGTAIGQIFSGDFNSWSLSATLSMPLHNYSAKASVANSQISQRQQMTQYRQREQSLTYDVRNQVRQVENLVQQVATATLRRELAARQLDAEQRKFEVGTSTNFQVLTFQNQFSQAQLAELQAILSLQNSLANLELTKGTILQAYGVQLGDAGTGGGDTTTLPGSIGGR